jgi:hypothetical protein
MKGMRTFIAIALMVLFASMAFGSEHILLQKAQGTVEVRAGVTETWTKAFAGDSLRPDATLKTGKQSSALIVLASTNRKISLPPEVMVDISDIRELTQEELLLKLTMEKVRSSSYEWKSKDMNLPNITPVHGDPKDKKASILDINPIDGEQQMKGTVVLYENGFYSTSALRAMDVLRRYPVLRKKFENCLLVPQALEKSNLKNEALNEYVELSMVPGLTKEQRDLIQSKITQLKRH